MKPTLFLPGFVAPASAGAAAPPTPGTPAYLQQAYDLAYLSQTRGIGDTIAIVDAFDDPKAESDLAVYRSQYGLPACTTGNGCFSKVNQSGNASPLPAANSTWEEEISLDLDAVSALCPNCHILLVEASSDNSTDLSTAMAAANAKGANQISASWTIGFNGVLPGTFVFSGVSTVAATGDAGYLGTTSDNYPAAFSSVTAAGGTTLAPTGGARGFSEGAWSLSGGQGGGSGCDLHVRKPTWQTDTGCSQQSSGKTFGRAYADVSADADPATGLSFYDSNNGGWGVIGGTSLATPLIAAYYAITGLDGTTPQWAYTSSALLNDPTSGSNGTCASSISYICAAGPGYDGPTGVGSISGAVVAGAPGIGGPSNGSGSAYTYTQSVRSHGATLTGGIYPNGHDTTWSVQYGTTTAYGQQTAATDIGFGTAPVAVTGYLLNLSPGTTYHYRLVAQNSSGTTYGYDYTFTTPAATATDPTASFTPPDPTTPNSSASFDAHSSTDAGASIIDYKWDFGDGTPVVDAGPSATTSHTFGTRGTYRVTLTVKNSAGQTDVVQHTVTADVAPTAAFSPSATVTTPGSNLNFDATGSAPGAGGTISDYSWHFGDGTTATGSNPIHSYANSDTYTVSLTVTDDLGITDTITHIVTVDAVPTASFAAAPDRASLAVAFDAGTSTDSPGTITDYSWDFGDGTTEHDAIPSTTHTYATRGHHTVTLTVTNDAGQTDTVQQDVLADVAPTAAFIPSATVTTPSSNLNFDATGSAPGAGGTISDYSWHFGDGSTDTGTTPTDTHAYASPGHYTVSLTVTDDHGITSTITHDVTVDAVPTASFAAAPDRTSLAVALDASGSTDDFGTINDYSWDFGDGTSKDSGSSATTTHAYQTPGHYTVTLTVANDAGQTSTSQQDVIADTTPHAAFAVPAGAQQPNRPVSFDSSASAAAAGASIKTYSWNFGDGSTGTGPNPSHAYSTPGHYTVELAVTDDLGVTSTTATRTVTVDAAPAASFSAGPNPATLGPAVAFDARGSSDSLGTITDYSWDFGDGTDKDSGSSATTTHAYQTPGRYTITLTTTNDAGQTATASHSITVDAAPSSSFSVSPSTTRTGTSVSFNAGSSSDTVGTIVAYAWNFGDGASASGLTARHAYASPGSYMVALTVTNDAGQTTTATQTVTVYAPPSASFSVSPATTLPGAAVNFNAGASSDPGGAITGYSWSFGDGATASGPGASHAYLRPGTYTVTLTVVGSLGLATSTSHTVTVNPPALGARLSARGRQKLTAVLKRGVTVSVFTSTAAKASFVVTMPTAPAKHQRKHGKRVAKARTSTILRTGALSYAPGTHAAALKLSAATAAMLRTAGKPVRLTVQMILTDVYGRTLGRSVKLTVTR